MKTSGECSNRNMATAKFGGTSIREGGLPTNFGRVGNRGNGCDTHEQI
jgi:hypothetical protein